MLPKSKRQAYVGYEEGPKAVKYYNAETRKVLTSQDYQFISAPPIGTPTLQGIVVAPDAQCKGEMRDGTLLTGGTLQDECLTGNAPKGVHLTRISNITCDTPRHSPQVDGGNHKRKRVPEDEGTKSSAEESQKT